MKFVVAALAASVAADYFDDMGKMDVDCEDFPMCKDDRVAIQSPKAKFVSHGCDDSGISMMGMGGAGGGGDEKFRKCCLQRDACTLTCGRTISECTDAYKECVQKKCKSDSQCKMMATIGGAGGYQHPDEQEKLNMFMTEKELENENAGNDKNFTVHMNANKCALHRQAQRKACRCVTPDKEQESFEEAIQAFYKSIKEKVPKGDELAKITEKWKGNGAGLFEALLKKYKKKNPIKFIESDRARKMRDMMGGIKSGGYGDMGGMGDFDYAGMGDMPKYKPPRDPPKPQAYADDFGSDFGSADEDEDIEEINVDAMPNRHSEF